VQTGFPLLLMGLFLLLCLYVGLTDAPLQFSKVNHLHFSVVQSIGDFFCGLG